MIAAGISLSVAGVALLLSRRFEGEEPVVETSAKLQPLAPGSRWLLVAAALAGFSLLGLERMYTWYRELQDAEDGSMLLHYTDLPREVAAKKFAEHLRAEAEKLLNKLEAQQGMSGAPAGTD